MDETYIKIKGVWHYLYRAVDKDGDRIDFMLFKTRKAAAKEFFVKAIGSSGLPEKITIDKKSGANKAGIDAINIQLIILFLLGLTVMQITIRQIKYLNNIVEQDHRSIKEITNPMMGFKAFYSTEATIAGIELHRMLRKGQHLNAANVLVHKQFYALAA